jgi:hypothetical protein
MLAMKTSPAHLLVLTCGLLIALFDLVALLPGNPVVTSVGGFVVVIAVQALIIWRLLHRSSMAWLLVVLVSGLYTVTSILVGGPWETTLVLTVLLASMQVALLCTPPVLVYVLGRDDGVA